MNEYFIRGTTLSDIAEAIREKTGDTTLIKPESFPEEIAKIGIPNYSAAYLLDPMYQYACGVVYFKEGATWRDYIDSEFNKRLRFSDGETRQFLYAEGTYDDNGVTVGNEPADRLYYVNTDNTRGDMVTLADKIIAGYTYRV